MNDNNGNNNSNGNNGNNKAQQKIENTRQLREIKKAIDILLNNKLGEAPVDLKGNEETIHYRLDRLEAVAVDLDKKVDKLFQKTADTNSDLSTIKGSLAFIGIFIALLSGLLFIIIRG